MKITKGKELTDLYKECPKCGSLPIGLDLDIIVTSSTFLRKCGCGWSIEVSEYKEPRPKNISTNGVCIARDCTSPIKARQLCERHYAQKRRGKLIELKFY